MIGRRFFFLLGPGLFYFPQLEPVPLPKLQGANLLRVAVMVGDMIFLHNCQMCPSLVWGDQNHIMTTYQLECSPTQDAIVMARMILYPIGFMYGIFTYIWLILMVNVGKYTIHGSYGIYSKHI